MLSVGVDIDRLGLMVMSAQPKTTAEYIQASSRIGRQHPGLVVQVYNWVRPRDISHYERFEHYHQTFYRHVEATSVTPFSERARDRALPGVLTSLVRHRIDGMAPNRSAGGFSGSMAGIDKLVDEIALRASVSSGRGQEMQEASESQLRDLVSNWSHTTEDGTKTVVYRRGGGTDDLALLSDMEGKASGGLWQISSSLREVEPEVDIVLMDDDSESLDGD